jgi:hypothetical protein
VRPYLAVLYDSLLESISSRVLWILLAGWTLILIALFPLSLSEGESYQVRTGDIASPKTVLDQLAAASAGRGTRAHRAVFEKLEDDFQDDLRERQKNGRKIFVGRLVASLNHALESEELYDSQAWPTAERREELKSLIEKKDKNPAELQKLNRRLLDLAFPNSIKSSAGQATWVTYAGMRFTDPLPITIRQIRPIIESTLLPLVMWIGLGQIAMMVAIVITSPMIPDMFQTGSLHLLLSKPLSRSLLYLSKYIGGCIFVAINIAYLIVGLYFYAGLQLGIWNRGILWCIPLFIFAFMVFYSVSALVGLIWKNPIICVVITALFWGACFTVGIIRGLSEGFLRGPPTLQRIVVVGDTPIVANQQGRIQFWNERQQQWQTAFGDVNGQRVMGPVWREADSTLYFGRPPFLPFGITTGDSTRLELARLPELKPGGASSSLEGASADGGSKNYWDDSRLDSGPDLPADTIDLIPWKDTFIAVTPGGLYFYDAEAAERAEQSKVSVFGFDLKIPQADEPYRRITENMNFLKPLVVEFAPATERGVVCARGKLIGLRWDQGKWTRDKETTLDFPAETIVNLAVHDHFAILCPNAMTPFVMDLDTMSVVQTLDAIGKSTVKRTSVDRTGRIALLTVEGDVWVLSRDAQQEDSPWVAHRPNLAGQGDVSAIMFDRSDRLWVAHHVKQVDAWDAPMSRSEISYRPRSTMPELIYNYLINPFYLINPKPAAINETIRYVLRNPENKINAIDRADLEIPRIEQDPWQPIWSNGIFIAVMLVAGCWYLYRQDL